MLKKHRLAELAPRDVVAREIFREKAGGRHVWLDARNAGPELREAISGNLRDLCARAASTRRRISFRSRRRRTT